MRGIIFPDYQEPNNHLHHEKRKVRLLHVITPNYELEKGRCSVGEIKKGDNLILTIQLRYSDWNWLSHHQQLAIPNLSMFETKHN